MAQIKLAYMRKNCKSCERAHAYVHHLLDGVPTQDARKNPVSAADAWTWLQDVRIIKTARGQRIRTWHIGSDDEESILQDIIGRSGNLRAPALIVDDMVIIGWHEKLYREWLPHQS